MGLERSPTSSPSKNKSKSAQSTPTKSVPEKEIEPVTPEKTVEAPAAAGSSPSEVALDSEVAITFRKSTRDFLEEYLSIEELEEAEYCLRDLSKPELHYLVVVELATLAFTKKEDQRETLFDVFPFFSKNKQITPEQFVKGFEILLKVLPDQVLDIPKAPTIVGYFLGRAVAAGLVPASFLKNQILSSLEARHAIQVVNSFVNTQKK